MTQFSVSGQPRPTVEGDIFMRSLLAVVWVKSHLSAAGVALLERLISFPGVAAYRVCARIVSRFRGMLLIGVGAIFTLFNVIPIYAIWWRRTGLVCAILALSLQTAVAGPVEDFYKLEDQMAEAHEAYVEALHTLESASGGKPVDKAKLPPDRRPAVLEKMDTLAAGSTGKPGGADAALGAFMWSWNLDIDLEHLVARFDHLVKHYASNLELDDVLPAVADAATLAKKPDDWVKTLNRLIAVTKRDQTRFGALFTLGRIQLGIKRLTDAKASFAKVLKSGGKSDYADQAKGYIHEIEHLQVGMVAPGFIAKKLDGKAISLKSLRGKAVLLNFWAAW